MSYELSFSPEFFSLPGELHDGAEYPHGERPYSVLGAIRLMDPSKWDDMCEEVFNTRSEFVDSYMVLAKVMETNTCSNLNAPVRVWIDEDGWYTVEVFERGGRPEM